jgi:uncharacterized membrane protein
MMQYFLTSFDMHSSVVVSAFGNLWMNFGMQFLWMFFAVMDLTIKAHYWILNPIEGEHVHT